MTKLLKAIREVIALETPKTNPDTGARIELVRVLPQDQFLEQYQLQITFAVNISDTQRPPSTILAKQELLKNVTTELLEMTNED